MNADAADPASPRPPETGMEPSAATLTAEEYALFEKIGRPRLVAPGEALFRRGDLGTTMYVIVQGEIDLDFGDDLVPRRLGRHEFFGELGLLIGDHARSADAVAASGAVLLELRQREFEPLAERDPLLLARFLRRAIQRVVLNEQSLIGRLRRRNADLQSALDTLRATTHRLTQTEALTRTDELTGLNNRRGFQLQLEQRRRNDALGGRGLLLIDCDRFKDINDEHGHQVGDRVLQGVANILRSAAGVDDIACRLGGDEFCLLVGAERQSDVLRIAQFVVDTAQALFKLQSAPPQITTLSIGACPVVPGRPWEEWYAGADAALYRAKRLGGNRVEWQDDALAPV
ncbi:GGDEF domain-containing protein [Luteimonas weifangensis]|uniref:diguanylate cyclase n=2 Tax=Cognatiluteimonas weifangensis TaxID=2303539 RepID=A0A372DPP4_9GAMM|nr:GGDEF domain-containing protein [Luteimonas weifangensis]